MDRREQGKQVAATLIIRSEVRPGTSVEIDGERVATFAEEIAGLEFRTDESSAWEPLRQHIASVGEQVGRDALKVDRLHVFCQSQTSVKKDPSGRRLAAARSVTGVRPAPSWGLRSLAAHDLPRNAPVTVAQRVSARHFDVTARMAAARRAHIIEIQIASRISRLVRHRLPLQVECTLRRRRVLRV